MKSIFSMLHELKHWFDQELRWTYARTETDDIPHSGNEKFRNDVVVNK